MDIINELFYHEILFSNLWSGGLASSDRTVQVHKTNLRGGLFLLVEVCESRLDGGQVAVNLLLAQAPPRDDDCDLLAAVWTRDLCEGSFLPHHEYTVPTEAVSTLGHHLILNWVQTYWTVLFSHLYIILKNGLLLHIRSIKIITMMPCWFKKKECGRPLKYLRLNRQDWGACFSSCPLYDLSWPRLVPTSHPGSDLKIYFTPVYPLLLLGSKNTLPLFLPVASPIVGIKSVLI